MDQTIEKVVIFGIVGGLFAVIGGFLMENTKSRNKGRGMSELMTKVCEGDIEACEKLIEANVDINQQDNKGATALIYAVLNKNELIIKLLLSKGADKNIATNKGLKPMAIAENNNLTSILEILN